MSLFNKEPQSICILRLSAVGDVCNALSVVQAIQTHFPKTEITWVVGKTEYGLLTGIPNIHFVVFDKKKGLHAFKEVHQALKGKRFDALLNMQSSFRASLLSLFIKAKYKIGFNKERAREGQWLFTNKKIERPSENHVLSGFIEFARLLGVPMETPHWNFYLPKEMKEDMSVYLMANKKNVLISPCSSKAEKDWTIEGYAATIQALHQCGAHILLAGSPSERERLCAQKIEQQCQVPVINLVGKTSLRELAALIAQVDLVIAPDSGPVHIANALDTTVIGLYAYHNPTRTGPYLQLDNVISVYEKHAAQEFKHSSTQNWAKKLSTPNLMQEISPQSVINKAKELLFPDI
ncbi:glycosyltransferase family 9 protein [Basilea psittacipulmonis]|uniref:Glycosyl transferase n=2 Tax=Basilea TaxID=1472344 RepID=A0A077DBU6_9BURK|nr:glycosyltransferase family 9 protein [Basilea psittacipulmonis]AIL32305.1 glycosyl transferase [Basilea psittacipulmonis DSM 24701]